MSMIGIVNKYNYNVNQVSTILSKYSAFSNETFTIYFMKSQVSKVLA